MAAFAQPLMSRTPRVDLSVVGAWSVDPDYLETRPESPTGQWLKTVAADYDTSSSAINRVLVELDLGTPIRASLERAAIPVTEWNRFVDVLHRLVDAGVLDRRPLDMRPRATDPRIATDLA